jgi:LysR family nitrogen assimilation transcriptional regulator
MELRQLKYFVAVVDNGSLSRAALQVFVAQSALSKQIAELEDELGEQLLHRSRNGVTATDAGKVLYSYAQAVLKQLNDVKTAIKSTPESIVGEVVLGLPHSVSAALALPLLRAARERLPGISLQLDEELAGNLLDQLQHGRVDVMVFTPLTDTDVVFRPFVEEEFYLLHGADAETSLSAVDDMDLATVARQSLIMPRQRHAHCTRDPVSSVAQKYGLSLNVIMEINSAHILKSAVEAGFGASVMPHALAALEIAAGRIRAHRIRPEKVVRTLGVCYSSHIPLTLAKRAVCELVFSVARKLCAEETWVGARYTGP